MQGGTLSVAQPPVEQRGPSCETLEEPDGAARLSFPSLGALYPLCSARCRITPMSRQIGTACTAQT